MLKTPPLQELLTPIFIQNDQVVNSKIELQQIKTIIKSLSEYRPPVGVVRDNPIHRLHTTKIQNLPSLYPNFLVDGSILSYIYSIDVPKKEEFVRAYIDIIKESSKYERYDNAMNYIKSRSKDGFVKITPVMIDMLLNGTEPLHDTKYKLNPASKVFNTNVRTRGWISRTITNPPYTSMKNVEDLMKNEYKMRKIDKVFYSPGSYSIDTNTIVHVLNKLTHGSSAETPTPSENIITPRYMSPHLYIVDFVGRDYSKIGISDNPTDRFSSLERSHGTKLKNQSVFSLKHDMGAARDIETFIKQTKPIMGSYFDDKPMLHQNKMDGRTECFSKHNRVQVEEIINNLIYDTIIVTDEDSIEAAGKDIYINHY